MTKKRLLVVSGLLLALLGIGLGVAALIPERPGVTKANFDRIDKGMTKAEVEKILGDAFHDGASFGVGGEMLWLQADDDTVAEIILKDDCVTDKRWHASVGTFSEIRRWLHID